MPSGRELQLWWSGEAESMFVYYLTGALGIALIASFTLTRSLRRKEPLVTELLHEDNTREDFVTYMLEMVTSPLSGCGCPSTVKVFMQLAGDRKMSQYFQIRSNSGGKAMLQRGFTDIFMFKVPESVGEVISVKLLIAGLNGKLKWKIEEAYLYSPSVRQRKAVPVVVKLLEVLDNNPSKTILVNKSCCSQFRKFQLLYHQWLAMYGNTIRLGAFTEVVHVMSVFMSLFTLLVLTQICYIYLPRGDHTLPTVASPIDNENEEDNSGPFDINLMSLLIGTALSAVCCCFLTFILEIMIRSVKSSKKHPGKAYQKICGENMNNFKKTDAICLDHIEQITYFTYPLFVRFNYSSESLIRNKTDKGRKYTEAVALYLKELIYSLLIEYERNLQNIEALKEKKMKLQKAFENKMEKERLKKEKAEKKMDLLKVLRAEDETILDFPLFSQIWFSDSSDSDDTRSLQSIDLIRSQSFTSKKSQGTYLDVLKRKALFRKFLRGMSESFGKENSLLSRREEMHEISNNALKRNYSIENEFKISHGNSDWQQHVHGSNRNSSSRATVDHLKDTGVVCENVKMQENGLLETCDKSLNAATGMADCGTKESDEADVKKFKNTSEIEEYNLNASVSETNYQRSDTCSVQITKDTAEEINSGKEESETLDNFKKTLKWMKKSRRKFSKAWQSDQKTWSRQVVREVCDVIRCTREMLLKDEINLYILKEKLLQSIKTVVQVLMVACTFYCTADQYTQLNTTEMITFIWHMAMEILVYTLQELYQVLLQRDNAVLADLVLQSHSVMMAINQAVYPIIYIVKYGADKVYLMSHIPLEKDMDCIIVELLKCCFELVVKYNLVLWQKLQFLLEVELKYCLDEVSYTYLSEFVDGNIKDLATENTVLKKLCNFVEESSRQEAWDEVHEEKTFFTSVLVKVQLLKALKNKITKITKKKYTFDETHDLLPKEPKSRLQLLVERRRKPTETEVKHVKWSKLKQNGNDSEESKENLEKQSKELGQFVENLSCIYEKCKKLMERQGVSQSLRASEYLAQAVLHPHVIVLPGKVNEPGMYTFDNYLHLKRTEVVLAQFFEKAGKDLMSYLLTTTIVDHKLYSEKLEDPDTVLNNVMIKADTMAQILCDDSENVMHECVMMEQYTCMSGHSKHSKLTTAVNSSVNSLLRTSVLKQWSDVDLTSSTGSKVIESNKMQENTDTSDGGMWMPHKNRNSLDNNNSDFDMIDMEDITVEVDTRNVTLKDIIEDLKPLKGYLEYVKHGEILRKMMTQMSYIERAKSKRDYLRTIQINNIIDSYFMIDEGDDSKTLTKSGLYQLEYDCTGEDRKPLGSWVKVIIVTLMLLSQIFIVVYITMVGGQFTTTELQEWMCYYLLAVGIFGLVFEPVRAYIVALFVMKLNKRLWQDLNSW